MRPVSARFLETVTKSHKAAIRATVLDATGTATVVEDAVTDGTVTLDQTAPVRGRCDVTFATEGDLVPTGSTSLLSVYGNELKLERGIDYGDGTSEYVSLGVFRIQDVDVSSGPDGLSVQVSGLDRAQRVIDARFEEPYQIAAGTNAIGALVATIQAAWPDVPQFIAGSSDTTPAVIAQEQDDRWAFVQEMATALARRLYFDGDGILVLVPNILGAVAATIAEGEDGVLLTADRAWTRQSSFNRVIATGEATSESVAARGIATDDDPTSPTYYFGPFGKVPRFYSSPFLISDAGAESAAQKILDDELGTTQSVNFGSLVLPHLEPGDTVRITRSVAAIDEDHILDSITIPLSASGTMTGATRARQVLV